MILKSKDCVDVNRHELMLEVEPKEFDDAVNAIFKKESSKMNIPGFRKGKAPRKFIEKYYGEEVFYDAAINHIYRKMVSEAVDQSELPVVTVVDVSIDEIGKDIGIKSKIIVVTKPEVKIDGYKGLKINKEIVDVSEDEIDEEIDRVRERNSRTVSVADRPAEDGDIVVIDYEGFVDDVPFDGGQADNHELTLGSGSFIPGFEEQIVGHSIEDEFDVNVTFPEQYHSDELAGKSAIFKVKLHEIKKKELPEADDEFVKDVSEFDTLDEYKADIKANIAKHKEEHAKADMESEIVEGVVDLLEADVPHEMIHMELDDIIENMGRRMQSQGLNLETYLQYTGMSMGDLQNQYHGQAEMQVKVRLGLEKIAELENITASEEEIDAEIEKIAEANNMPADTVKAMVSREMVASDVVNRKTVEFLQDSAEITELSSEEMTKLKEEKQEALRAKAEADAEALQEEEIDISIKDNEE